MKRVFLMVVVVCTLVPSLAHAQIVTPSQLFLSCGTIRTGNQARQYGQHGMWLQYIVSTVRDINTCPLTVAVEAHVPGVAGSGLSTFGLFSASVNRQIPVPYPGTMGEQGNPRSHYLAAVADRGHAVPAGTPPDIGCRRLSWSCERRSIPCTSARSSSRGAGLVACVSSQLSAHRRHRPRRLQAHERRKGRPVRSERSTVWPSRSPGRDATRTMRFWCWIGTATDA